MTSPTYAELERQLYAAKEALIASDDFIREVANQYNLETKEGRRISIALAKIIHANAAVLGPPPSQEKP